MYCEKCGNKLGENVSFCGKCGAKIGESGVKNYGSNNSESQISISLSGNIITKILFLIGAIITVIISRAELINLDFYEMTLFDFVDYAEGVSYIADINKFTIIVAKISVWAINIGCILCIIAGLACFFNEKSAREFVMYGGVLNLLGIVIFVLIMKYASESSIGYVLELFSTKMYIFIALNIILIIFSKKFLYVDNFAKSYKALPSNAGLKVDWRCSECNRMNSSYIGTCACGKKRD